MERSPPSLPSCHHPPSLLVTRVSTTSEDVIYRVVCESRTVLVAEETGGKFPLDNKGEVSTLSTPKPFRLTVLVPR